MKDDLTWTDEGTLYSEVYGDIYYHDGQGLAETEYVFLDGNKFRDRIKKNHLIIGELGFGTGLNFLTSWLNWKKAATESRLTFVSCEKHPLDLKKYEKAHASFPQLKELSQELRSKLPPIKNGFHFLEFEEGKVSLLLMFGDAVDVYKQFEGKIDAWYLGGFAPSKNPEMWSADLFQQLARHSHDKTTLATFTAAGFVRRGLTEAGFEIERIKGFGHKKHMTTGRFTGHVVDSPSLSPWFRNPPKRKLGKVAVIGAGVAGLNVAYYLSRYGIDVTVYDKNSEVVSEASGNRWGMVYPLISKKVDRLGTFTKIGCAFIRNQLDDLGVNYSEGLLEFITSEKKETMISGGLERLPKSYLERLSPDQIKEQFGLDYAFDAALHKKAVTFSPKEYAQKLVDKGNFKCELEKEISKFTKVGSRWKLVFNDGQEEIYDSVFITSAYNSKTFPQTSFLPIRKVRGQVVYLPKELISVPLEMGMNYVNYLVKESNGDYVLGATFQVDDEDESYREQDTKDLLESFNETFPDLVKDVNFQELNGRVCFRAVQKDFFPLVGPVCKEEKYKEEFEKIKYGGPIYKYPDPTYYEGLFVLAGLGARGLSTSAMLASYLAKMLNDRISSLPEQHVSSVHPGRFIIRRLKRH